MDPILTTVGVAALTQGITFLYAQATEVLKSWRARRRGEDTTAKVIDPPEGVTVGEATKPPLAEPRDARMEDTLLELQQQADEVRSGEIAIDSAEGRAIVSHLRDYLEVVLGAPITLVGEAPRTLEAGRIQVTAGRVEGEVIGVVARGGATGRVGDVVVDVDEVGKGGRATGVELG